jgi:DNA-binding winged helix-turn-helix (wHTH) protein
MVYRFAECELDERLYQLRREGSPIALEPKVFDVLAYLVQHRDRVVSKDELLDKLWPGQVVGENALTRCIRAARSAVGDDGVKQDIIATQHGRGYRFIATVITTLPRVPSSEFQVSSQEEEKQKAKEEVEIATEKEKSQLNDVGLRTPDLQDPSSNSLDSSSPSLIPNT